MHRNTAFWVYLRSHIRPWRQLVVVMVVGLLLAFIQLQPLVLISPALIQLLLGLTVLLVSVQDSADSQAKEKGRKSGLSAS